MQASIIRHTTLLMAMAVSMGWSGHIEARGTLPHGHTPIVAQETSNTGFSFRIAASGIDVTEIATNQLTQFIYLPLSFGQLTGAFLQASERVLVVGNPATAQLAVYDRAPDGKWHYTTLFVPQRRGAVAKAHFGERLVVTDDLILVGSHHPGGSDEVWAVRRSEQGWSAAIPLNAPADDKASGFGSSFATNGKDVWIAAPGYDDGSGVSLGAVYSWSLDSEHLVSNELITPNENWEGQDFGYSLGATPSGVLIAGRPEAAGEVGPAVFVRSTNPSMQYPVLVESASTDSKSLPLLSGTSNNKGWYCNTQNRPIPYTQYYLGEYGVIVEYYCCSGMVNGWADCDLYDVVWKPSPRYQEP